MFANASTTYLVEAKVQIAISCSEIVFLWDFSFEIFFLSTRSTLLSFFINQADADLKTCINTFLKSIIIFLFQWLAPTIPIISILIQMYRVGGLTCNHKEHIFCSVNKILIHINYWTQHSSTTVICACINWTTSQKKKKKQKNSCTILWSFNNSLLSCYAFGYKGDLVTYYFVVLLICFLTSLDLSLRVSLSINTIPDQRLGN